MKRDKLELAFFTTAQLKRKTVEKLSFAICNL